MEGESSKTLRMITRESLMGLECGSEPGREGGEGMSEGSVGEVSFCYVSFRELERKSSKIMEW